MVRILVTGGCGFIGSHTCLALLEKNYDIWVIDSCINSSPKSLEMVKKLSNKKSRLNLFKGDLRNIDFIKEIFLKAKNQGTPIDGVIHFAGLKSIEESINQPIKYWNHNVIGTINLLNIMNENKCKTIVFSSSALIYGEIKDLPLKESGKIKSNNPYGTTKSIIEKFLNEIYLSSPNEWRISSLRYFNPIGAHHSGLLGEYPLGEPKNIFPLMMQVALGKIKRLQIFGNNWPTPDGTAIRDYIHVLDLADGHILALEFLLNEKPQIINLNLGTGKGTSVLELINTFERANKVKIPYEFIDRRKGDFCTILADNSLSRSILEWIPKRDLNDMCVDGWKWQSSNPEGYI
tara:strand:+ start:203 stop:1243 length:1041 start_codon:yes stop_codon:yes gene_type:complete